MREILRLEQDLMSQVDRRSERRQIRVEALLQSRRSFLTPPLAQEILGRVDHPIEALGELGPSLRGVDRGRGTPVRNAQIGDVIREFLFGIDRGGRGRYSRAPFTRSKRASAEKNRGQHDGTSTPSPHERILGRTRKRRPEG